MLGSMRQVVRVSLMSAAAGPTGKASATVSPSTPAAARSAALLPDARMVSPLAPVPLGLFESSLDLIGQWVSLRLGWILRKDPDQSGIHGIHRRAGSHHHEMDAPLLAPDRQSR